MATAVIANTAQCNFAKLVVPDVTDWTGVVKDIEVWQCIILLLCFGAFALFISLIHRVIRTYIYYDAHLLDTFFDAGGDTNFGMIACSLVAKYMWSSVFIIPVVGVYKYGLVGHFWYAAALALQLFLFAIVATEIRIKAPGAKTYLQVIKSRFGTGPHIVIMMFALFLNMMISGMVMMEATRIITSLTIDINKEVVCIVLAIVVGFYTVVGGVGGSIYVAYFACVLVFSVVLVLVTDLFWNPLEREINPYGSDISILSRVRCAVPDVDNEMDNGMQGALTFVAPNSMVEGVALVMGSFGMMFVDQAFWQSGVAAKPNHGVWGFITGGLAWFSVPFCFSFVVGLGYWAMVADSGGKEHLVSLSDAEDGVLTVQFIQKLWGTSGSFLCFALVEVAAVTTVSGQVLAASSIVVYDIYQTYIAPFKSLPLPEGKDVSLPMRRAIRTEEYLEYDKRSVVLKHVVVVCLTFVLLAVGVILLSIDIDTWWLFFATSIVVDSCVLPIVLAITWHRVTGPGVATGALVGAMAGIITWLVYAATFEGELEAFRENTGRMHPLIAGQVVSLLVGGLLCIIVSLACGGCDKTLHEEEVWEKTREIDNPVLPWSVKYAPDIKGQGLARGRPHFYTVRRIFKCSEVGAYLIGVLLAVLMILVWPACMLMVDLSDTDTFDIWKNFVLILSIVMTSYITVIPLLWEIVQTCRQAYYNRQWARNDHRGERLQEEHSEPDQNTYKSDPTPSATPPRQPTPTMLDDRSESEFQSTLGKNAGTMSSAGTSGSTEQLTGRDDSSKERWKTFIHLD